MTDRTIDDTPSEAATSEARTSGRAALVALAVAAAGVVAFAYGLRTAVVRLPPERAAGAARTTPDTARAGRFTPPAQNQPDEYPRLR